MSCTEMWCDQRGTAECRDGQGTAKGGAGDRCDDCKCECPRALSHRISGSAATADFTDRLTLHLTCHDHSPAAARREHRVLQLLQQRHRTGRRALRCRLLRGLEQLSAVRDRPQLRRPPEHGKSSLLGFVRVFATSLMRNVSLDVRGDVLRHLRQGCGRRPLSGRVYVLRINRVQGTHSRHLRMQGPSDSVSFTSAASPPSSAASSSSTVTIPSRIGDTTTIADAARPTMSSTSV